MKTAICDNCGRFAYGIILPCEGLFGFICFDCIDEEETKAYQRGDLESVNRPI